MATQWVTTSNAPFSDRNKVFQAFLKTFEIASNTNQNYRLLLESTFFLFEFFRKRFIGNDWFLLPQSEIKFFEVGL